LKDSFPLWPTPVVLKKEYISTHKHIIGLTGMGKSKVLESIFMQLFHQRIGVSFIDPHGTSANAILRTLIAEGYFQREDWDQRLLYIEFTEDGPYLPFNILNQPRFRSHTIGEHVLQAFHRCWPALGDGAASRFDNLMLASTNVLIDNGLPLPAVHLLLTREWFRNQLLANTRDPFIVSVFKDRMDEWSKRDAPQMKESTLARIFLLAYQPVLRYSLGQRENVLDFRQIMDSGTSVIFNLARIQDEDTQRMLACLLTLGYERAAVSRGDHDDPESLHWSEHHLLLDEFQNYTANSEGAMKYFLSQSRKYDVYLTLSHQTWDQASARIQGALQNVGVRIGLRLGPDDSDYFNKVFGTIDPKRTKREETESGLELFGAEAPKGMKGFLELSAQWQEWTQLLMDLPKREALVKPSGKPALHFKTAEVPAYTVSTEQLVEVKDRYRQKLMKQLDQVPEARNQFVEDTPIVAQPKLVTPEAFARAYQLNR